MDQEHYANVLSRILRDILAAGSARDYDRMIELARELEDLARFAEKAEGGSPDDKGG
ncbi:hypothetical protein ES703_79053 [subsurface metagenome]